MSDAASPTLVLAVPGTQDTHTLDIPSIQGAVARGEIALDNWAWSPTRNEWLPLAQVPEYAQAPAPPVVAPVVKTVTVPAVTAPAIPAMPVMPAARVVQPTAAAQATPVRVATPAQVPVARTTAVPAGQGQMAATYYSKPIEERHEFPIFKVLFAFMGLVIAGLIAVNYFMVDQPFRAALAKTAFPTVQAHAHLAAFAQPNALLIHVRPSAQLNDDNFADFLTALVQSAPRSVIPGELFSTLGLTSEWFSQYIITSDDWDGFADMSGYSAEEKRHFILVHLKTSDGEPVYVVAKNQDTAARQARESAVWKQLVANFSVPGA